MLSGVAAAAIFRPGKVYFILEKRLAHLKKIFKKMKDSMKGIVIAALLLCSRDFQMTRHTFVISLSPLNFLFFFHQNVKIEKKIEKGASA